MLQPSTRKKGRQTATNLIRAHLDLDKETYTRRERPTEAQRARKKKERKKKRNGARKLHAAALLHVHQGRNVSLVVSRTVDRELKETYYRGERDLQ